MKLGVIGAASIFRNRWQDILKSHSSIEFIGVARRELSRGDSAIYRKGYFSFSKEEVDVVYIPLPNNLHYEVSKYYLEMGINVIIEKPSTTSYEKTKELVGIANRNKCFFLESFQWRYHNRTQDLIKKITNSGNSVYRVDVIFTMPHLDEKNIRYQPELNGGAAYDLGAYPVSVITTLFKKIRFDLSYFRSWKNQYEVDIGGSGIFTSENNEMEISFLYGFGLAYHSKLIVYCTDGRYELNQPFTAPSNNAVEIILEKNLSTQSFVFTDCHFNRLLDFITSNPDLSEINSATLLQSSYLQKIVDKI